VDIHDYLTLTRRYLLLLIAVPLVAGGLMYLQSSRQPTKYTATATVLLRPNDPNERLGTGSNGSTEVFNATAFVRAQQPVVEGPNVVDAAASFLGNVSADEVKDAITVVPAVDSNILRISATTLSADQSQGMANAVARSYIENRRKSAAQGLEQALENIQTKIDEAAADLNKFARGTQDATKDVEFATAQAQYTDLKVRQGQLEIDLDLKRGEAELIAPASKPKTPVSPHPLKSAFLALVFALFATLGAALLRERLDLRLRNREEAEEVTNLPTLAEIPLDRASSKDPSRLAADVEPDGLVAEAVRSLRVSLRFLGLDRPLQVLLVTSAVPGDGKSTIATNLAASYAQSGVKTLLVSADLRRPRVEALTSTRNDRGLTDLLTEMAADHERNQAVQRRLSRSGGGSSSSDDATPLESGRSASGRRSRAAASNGMPDTEIAAWCQNDMPNLFVLPAGASIASPLEILSSAVTREFFKLARRDFEMVVLDSPPVVLVSDAIVLSQQVDGVLVVASLRKTSRAMLQRAVELLASSQVRVVGLVLNRVTRENGGYYGTYSGAYSTDRGE
jgi:polysaccharide biosynthesis transport protein